jgi:hypothetical protein
VALFRVESREHNQTSKENNKKTSMDEPQRSVMAGGHEGRRGEQNFGPEGLSAALTGFCTRATFEAQVSSDFHRFDFDIHFTRRRKWQIFASGF